MAKKECKKLNYCRRCLKTYFTGDFNSKICPKCKKEKYKVPQKRKFDVDTFIEYGQV